ncbi:MAG: MAPEG family protein [Sphingomicrobium sp.]
MSYSPILIPVVALVAWSLLVCLWMLVARFHEFRRLGITPTKIPDGARGVDLEGKAAPEAQWKSHNYNHLMEQPTLFYAIAITLALMGFGGGINYWLAWGYVGLRIVHSLIQATTNIVRYRLPVFLLATLCLAGLTVHAGSRILHDCGFIG